MNQINNIFLLLIFISINSFSQNIKFSGRVINENDQPILNTSIIYGNKKFLSDTNGYFSFYLKNIQKNEIIFKHESYNDKIITFYNDSSEIFIDVLLELKTNLINEVELIDETFRFENITSIDKKKISYVTGPSSGVEGVLFSLPGVTSKNELSSQYSVRGGNFDENLVYVNGFQIYRPFLIRKGEQEGLSFINQYMVEDINFSSGGFESKYGDKLSSVLDIKYRDPKEWKSFFDISFMGFNSTVEGISKSLKWTHLTSIRRKTNQFLLNSLDTKSDYRPSFTDIQTLNNYYINSDLNLSLLIHYASNEYQSIPESRVSDFGTINQPFRINLFFDGMEKDSYSTLMSAVKIKYKPSDSLSLTLSSSIINSLEQEFFDVEAQYFLGEVENDLSSENFGQISQNLGIGGFLRHARNELQYDIFNIYHNGDFFTKSSKISWGIKFQNENIDDILSEWQYIDSSGYSLPQSNDSILEMYNFISSKNNTYSKRVTSYFQSKGSFNISDHNFNYNFGFRTHYWSLNNDFFISPRFLINYKPNFKRDILIKFSYGSYNQSPFYREIRNMDGQINKVNHQKSDHYILTADYNFNSWGRKFKLISSLYYKNLKRLIPYELENLRIRYLPNLQSNGYVTGMDLRLNGEFVNGVDSWISLSIMDTKEDIKGDGYGFIPRPTDQRFSLSILFQDYLPNNPTYRLNFRLLYSSGMPTGSLSSERYNQTLRIPAYRRVDLGFLKVFNTKKILKKFDSFILNIDIFNLFGIRNTISYLWISDVNQNEYAVPNYLTSRILNLRLNLTF